MTPTAYTPATGARITALLATFKLPSASRELVRRFVAAGLDGSLPLLCEVLELEAGERRERRVDRLRRASKLPPGKTFDTLEQQRLPRPLVVKLKELATGEFLDRGDNVLVFGATPVSARATPHARSDTRSFRPGRSVLFVPTFQLVQELLAARRDLGLPRALRALDVFDLLILDDIGYVQQSTEEAEVLFTLMAERYERRSLLITSNLVFSQWDRIFKNQMTTAAAVDRLVHHASILELDVPSFRTQDAKNRSKKNDDNYTTNDNNPPPSP